MGPQRARLLSNRASRSPDHPPRRHGPPSSLSGAPPPCRARHPWAVRAPLGGQPILDPSRTEAVRPTFDLSRSPGQLRADGAMLAGGAEEAHRAAEYAVSGSGGPLPFLDRIQTAFGRHDVRGVIAHA